MPYPRQETVQKALEAQTRKDMRGMENAALSAFGYKWGEAKGRLKANIIAQHGGKSWTLAKAKQKGLQSALNRAIDAEIVRFKTEALPVMRDGLKTNYRGELLRQAWMLDVLTPPNVHPKIKIHPHYREAVSIYSGRNAALAWNNRFSAWTDAWATVLKTNLSLEIMHSGSATDFSKEVDASKVGSPAFDAWDIFKNIMLTEILSSQSEARVDFSKKNGGMIYDEVWTTMDDERVCEICGPLDGVSMSKVNEFQPAHPRCRCYRRVVPKAWADLADRDLANEMDRRGLVPDAMVIRGENGIIKGAAIVTFDKWVESQPQLITSGM
jgi:hypothetical protein